MVEQSPEGLAGWGGCGEREDRVSQVAVGEWDRRPRGLFGVDSKMALRVISSKSGTEGRARNKILLNVL